MAIPANRPIIGIIVTHFSFGSFFASHGRSTSPFLTRREWKYLFGRDRIAEELPNDEAGRELSGDENGFILVEGAGETAAEVPSPSSNGLRSMVVEAIEANCMYGECWMFTR